MTQNTNASQAPTVLNTESAAARLGVAGQTLRRWRCTGDGPPFLKLGSDKRNARVVYLVKDLDAWLEAQRRTPGEAA